MKKLNISSNSDMTNEKQIEKIIVMLMTFIVMKRSIFNALILKIASVFIIKLLINLLNNSH